MRLRVRHHLGFKFAEPARNITRILRLTPRSHEGQHVVSWQIDVDADCILKAGEDGFGNITHTFTAKGPLDRLGVTVTGEIDSFDAAGVVRGSAERMPTELYLRDTPATAADTALRQFGREAAPPDGTVLDQLHALMRAIHDRVAFEPARPDAETAAAAFAEKAGNGCDLAQIFTGCARHMGVPVRVTRGYYLCEDQKRGITHAWAEAFVPGLGWTGFDPAHKVCPQDTHVRLASGLDALQAAPVRGIGGDCVADELSMTAPVAMAWSQSQSQSQGAGWQRQSQRQG